ncbi:DHH family phosphoesterase [Candidatus Woesearchaeota archaeon]|nr:DHH family phosphoesterase [Candidatus Woesearchaeota archaeon]
MDYTKQTVQRFDAFVKSLTANDRIALMHDTDPDGICSGALVAASVERIRKKPIDLVIPKGHEKVTLTDENLKMLQQNKINKLITTDLGIDGDPATVRQAEVFCEIVIFDHHKISNDVNSPRTIVAKAQYITDKIDSSQYPASKLVYDLFSRHVDLSDRDWVAAAGLIADASAKTWQTFLDGLFVKYGEKKLDNIFDTPFGMVGRIITSSIGIDAAHVPALFKCVLEAKSYKDVLSSKFKEYEEKYSAELKRCIDECRQKAEFHPELELIWYEIKSPYKINSPVSTILSFMPENLSMTIIIAQDMGDGAYAISSRRQDGKIAMNDLMENAIKGLEKAGGGGHKPAAGARVLKNDWRVFKKRVLDALKDFT